MPVDVLGPRQLNRATLERQLLLRRSALTPADAVRHLVGMQSQNPLDPYLGLWSRLDCFDADVVSRMLLERALVRIVVMRGTIHLVTAADAAALRPLMQPVLTAELARHPEFAPHLTGVDLAPLMAVGRTLLAEQPMTGTQLRAALSLRVPNVHAGALAYACRCLLPLVQVPPRGLWRRSGAVRSTPLDAWTSLPMGTTAIDEILLRYLAAFGPATSADVGAWSRLTGMREVLARLRPKLRVFHDTKGRELFDLPDAPRPDGDVPAPVRFLPEYDNVLLSHADRSRFAAGDGRRLGGAVGPIRGTVLVDGVASAVWHVERESNPDRAMLVVEHLPLSARSLRQVAREAVECGVFWCAAAQPIEVRLVPVIGR